MGSRGTFVLCTSSSICTRIDALSGEGGGGEGGGGGGGGGPEPVEHLHESQYQLVDRWDESLQMSLHN